MASEPVNVNEFRELARLRPRVLVDVSRVDMSTTVLGYKISAPIMIAPTARHQLAHPEGEVATARAAAACNTIMVLSNISTCTVEDVASSCNAFFQFLSCLLGLKLSNGTFPEQVYKRRDISAQIVQRAEKSGYKAIILTVDAPRLGRREADIKNRMVAPQLKNFEGILSTDVNSDEGLKVEAFVKETFDASLCDQISFACQLYDPSGGMNQLSLLITESYDSMFYATDLLTLRLIFIISAFGITL
ncbi:unnamed protein product [Prunus armeniaca]